MAMSVCKIIHNIETKNVVRDFGAEWVGGILVKPEILFHPYIGTRNLELGKPTSIIFPFGKAT